MYCYSIGMTVRYVLLVMRSSSAILVQPYGLCHPPSSSVQGVYLSIFSSSPSHKHRNLALLMPVERYLTKSHASFLHLTSWCCFSSTQWQINASEIAVEGVQSTLQLGFYSFAFPIQPLQHTQSHSIQDSSSNHGRRKASLVR